MKTKNRSARAFRGLSVLLTLCLLVGLLPWAAMPAMAAGGNISGAGTAANPYIIADADDWATFASNVSGGTTYNGKTVKLIADIAVTTAAGSSSSSSFQGTFDGDGHTLTVILEHTGGGDAFIAPFQYINGATIKRLHTEGTITTDGKMAGGIVGDSWGTSTIRSCRSSVTISSSISGDGTHGGLVGRVNNGTLTITDCLFDGVITGENTNSCGGFVGWKGTSLVLNRCLQAGNLSGISNTSGSTFVRYNSGSVDFSTCYYETAYGTAQGTSTAVVGDLAAALGSGWETVGARLLPIMDGRNLLTAAVSGVHPFYLYSGSAIPVSYTVTDADGTVLTKGTDYTESFSPATVQEKGDYTLTVTGKGRYYGTRVFSFTVADMSWSVLKAALEAGQSITLPCDVACPADVSETITLTAGAVTLDLNGHTLTGGDGSDVIKIQGGSLTLRDSGGTGRITHAEGASGRGIYVYGYNVTSTLTMEGGTICGNTYTPGDGAGVYVYHQNSSFTMTGGTISGNSARHGGGVGVSMGGSFTMSGTSLITGNSANGVSYSYGGGVYITSNTSSFTMSGGSITANTSRGSGGGIYETHSNSLRFSGNVTVTGNRGGVAADGTGGHDENFYINNTSASINVSAALDANTRIGVTLNGGARAFTTNLSGRGTTANFISDDAGYAVRLNNKGNARLAVLSELTIDASEHGTVTAVVGDSTVADGSTVAEGDTVILAVAPAAGYALDTLQYNDGEDHVITPDGGVYSFTMPAQAVTVTATYVESQADTYAVTVTNGTGSGNYAEGVSVAITANAPESGKRFKEWTGAGGLTFTAGSATDATAVFTMPAEEVTLTATYETIYAVTVTPGASMTWTSGSASQTVDAGSQMTPVVYKANDGWYFPEDYSIAAVNGVGVTRNSYTQITVSGTPTDNTTITLIAPTAKTKPDAPTEPAAEGCTTSGNNDGKLTGVTAEMEYKKSDVTDWTVGTDSDITGLTPGYYYVRIRATDTTLPSDNLVLAVASFDAPSYAVTVTPGANMTRTGGHPNQNVFVDSPMTPVVYTANEGYYFPEDYSVATVNGVGVTRNSYTQITVSGTPTDHTTITLTAPTAKTKPDAPTGIEAVDCSNDQNNDGMLIGVTTAMEYKKSDAADWTAGTGSNITGLVPGTYYVRYQATDTTLPSDNLELTVEGVEQAPIDPTGVLLNQHVIDVVSYADPQTLTATIAPSGATGTLVWSSSNENIASVTDNHDGTATVTINGVGTANITVSIQGTDYSDVCTVCVTEYVCEHEHKIETAAKAATCTESGNNKYYYCDDCHQYLKADGTTVTTVEAETIPALGHNYENVAYSSDDTRHWKVCSRCNEDSAMENHTWGDATYTWEPDNSRVTASHTCTVCGKEVTETVNTTSQVTAATCTEGEITTYTATFLKDGFTAQTKANVVTSDPLGHDWDDPTYTWSDDCSTCTARRVCTRDDCGEEEEETANATSVSTATCTHNGTITYTATFTNAVFNDDREAIFNGFDGRTKVIDVDELGHSFVYTADGANLSVVCEHAGCENYGTPAVMTIVAPTLTVYGGTGSATATLTGLTDFNRYSPQLVAETDIRYAGRDGTAYAESAAAPTGAGKYTARITVGGATAKVDYEIAKAEGPAAPTGLSGVAPSTYGGSDGRITGVTAAMEYSADGRDFTACAGTQITGLTAGTYYVRVAETATHKAGAAATVTVPDALIAPVITTQPLGVTVAEGETATFRVVATGATGYRWYYQKPGDSGWTAVAKNGKSAAYSVTTAARHNGYKYMCAVTNAVGTTESETVTLTVNSKPVITTQPASVTVNEGSKATFEVVATGADSYQWCVSKDSGATWSPVKTNGTAATYSLTTAARHDGYQYKCAVKNAGGTVETNVVTLTVNGKPTITTQPTSVTVDEGETAAFRVTATGATSFKWYCQKPNTSTWTAVKINGTSATYTLTTAARHSGYKYKCKVTNAAGTVETNVVTLTVNSKPVITTQPTSLTVDVGSKATFKVVATGATGYRWYYMKPGDSSWIAVAKNGTSATYSVTAAARHNGYKYKCAVTNAVGTVETRVVTLTVNS